MRVFRYNPKHLCPKLNGYGDNGQRKVWSFGGSMHYSCQLTCYQCLSLSVAWYYVSAVNCMCFLQGMLQMRCEWSVSCAELLKCLLCFHTWNIVICTLCMDFAMAMHVLLLKNTKGVFPIEGFRLCLAYGFVPLDKSSSRTVKHHFTLGSVNNV
jgi:hypothetical protein